jgi:hypothetical protein
VVVADFFLFPLFKREFLSLGSFFVDGQGEFLYNPFHKKHKKQHRITGGWDR